MNVEKQTKRAKGFENKKELSAIIFRLGSEIFALDSKRVLEIMPLPFVMKIPLVERYVLGLSELRGEALLVVDLYQLILKRDSNINPNNYALVYLLSDEYYAFTVDKVLQVINVSSLSSEKQSDGTADAHQYIDGYITHQRTKIKLINLERLLKALQVKRE